MKLKEKIYWIWLSRIEGLSNKNILKLLKKYKSPQNIWNLSRCELEKDEVDLKVIDKLLDLKYRYGLNKYLIYMENNNIDVITCEDEDYPIKLKNIIDYPFLLYIKGNKKILNDFSLGIIGCRNYSIYGEKVAKYFSEELSKKNINIVSGLARGIDTFAHIGCMKSKAKTIAVVGNGLDKIYPPENKKIAEKIIETGGVIISEYIIGTKPLKYNFPARNRIISGISDGILVVEAREKSGTLITVDFALDQGKNIFVIPGNIDSNNSVGTNKLIGQGAKITTEIDDILNEYNLKH